MDQPPPPPLTAQEEARLRRLWDGFEDLVLEVWACEVEWRLDDRIEIALGLRRYRR